MKKESKSELKLKYRADLETNVACDSGPYLQPANRERRARQSRRFFLGLPLLLLPSIMDKRVIRTKVLANGHSEHPLRNEVMAYEQSQC